MLKENGAAAGGKWAEIAVLEPVRDYKARHASTLLTFEATLDCVDQIEGAEPRPGRTAPSEGDQLVVRTLFGRARRRAPPSGQERYFEIEGVRDMRPAEY